MKNEERLLGVLGLCRKAGALVLGFDAAIASVKSGEAALVVYTSDCSPKTQKELLFHCGVITQPLPIPLAMQETQRLFHKRVAVMAVTNKELAKKICTLTEAQERSDVEC